MTQSMAAHPDRLLPFDAGTQAIARGLLVEVQHLPLISPHGHIPAEMIADETDAYPDTATATVAETQRISE